jgi:hypothetical protein
MLPVAADYGVAMQFVPAMRGFAGKCHVSATFFVMSENIPAYLADAEHEYKARHQNEPFT